MSVAARDVLTVVFLGVGGYCLLRCVLANPGPGGHRQVHRLSDVAHVGMSVGMVAMLWHPVDDRWGLQLAFFALGGGWFLARAVNCARDAGRPGLLHQAVAMAAMFWMLTLLGTPLGTAAGMRMAGIGAGPGGAAASGAAATATTLTLASYLIGAALWWLRRIRVLAAQPTGVIGGHAPTESTDGRAGASFPNPVFGPAGDAVCQAVMAAATAVVLITMV